MEKRRPGGFGNAGLGGMCGCPSPTQEPRPAGELDSRACVLTTSPADETGRKAGLTGTGPAVPSCRSWLVRARGREQRKGGQASSSAWPGRGRPGRGTKGCRLVQAHRFPPTKGDPEQHCTGCWQAKSPETWLWAKGARGADPPTVSWVRGAGSGAVEPGQF